MTVGDIVFISILSVVVGVILLITLLSVAFLKHRKKAFNKYMPRMNKKLQDYLSRKDELHELRLEQRGELKQLEEKIDKMRESLTYNIVNKDLYEEEINSLCRLHLTMENKIEEWKNEEEKLLTPEIQMILKFYQCYVECASIKDIPDIEKDDE